MRIVIDSNVWISALVFGGEPRRVLEAVAGDGHSILLSQEISTEVRRILHTKFSDFVEDFDDLLVVMNPRIEHVALGSARVEVCRDPDDNRVIETAVIGGSELILTGDKDLLALQAYKQIKICAPAEALKMYL